MRVLFTRQPDGNLLDALPYGTYESDEEDVLGNAMDRVRFDDNVPCSHARLRSRLGQKGSDRAFLYVSISSDDMVCS